MKALICGSLAFDTIMVFHDKFKNHILPDKVHILNVSFLVPELRREYGGCAGNIAYSLKLLGGEPVAMGTVGKDFDHYRNWMESNGISTQYVRTIDEHYTAQAFITTDMDDNQITAFHPGAMSESHRNTVPRDFGIKVGIVSPDGRDGMIQHAEQFAQASIPFIFDPGQGMPMFDGNDLNHFISLATYVTVNDYEAQLLQSRTGKTPKDIANEVSAYVVTKGAEGASIFTDGKQIDIPVVKADQVQDPTGCGDAFRAGLLYGLTHDMDWETTGRIASLCASQKVACHGTQNHRFTPAEFADKFAAAFGYKF